MLLHLTRLLKRKNVELGLHVTAALKAAGRSCAYLITGAPDAQNPASQAYAEYSRSLRSELGLEDDTRCFLQAEVPIPERDLASLFVAGRRALFSESSGRVRSSGARSGDAPAAGSSAQPSSPAQPAHAGRHPVFLDAEPAQIALTVAARLGTTEGVAGAAPGPPPLRLARGVYANYLAPLLAEFETVVPA